MDPGSGELFDPSGMLEEIYVWDTGPHDVFAAPSAEAKERIRRDLLDSFAPNRSPADRSVDRFLGAVSGLLQDPGLRPGTKNWADGPDVVMTAAGEERNLRVDATLGVLRHFLWVGRVYASVPGASVLLRRSFPSRGP